MFATNQKRNKQPTTNRPSKSFWNSPWFFPQSMMFLPREQATRSSGHHLHWAHGGRIHQTKVSRSFGAEPLAQWLHNLEDWLPIYWMWQCHLFSREITDLKENARNCGMLAIHWVECCATLLLRHRASAVASHPSPQQLCRDIQAGCFTIGIPMPIRDQKRNMTRTWQRKSAHLRDFNPMHIASPAQASWEDRPSHPDLGHDLSTLGRPRFAWL